MKKHHVIYIFGLGDHRARGQTLAVKLWNLYGVKSEVFHMSWRDTEPFTGKLEALLRRIDTHISAGDDVSLVAASAGASAAINAFALRQAAISGVVLLCGKVSNPQTMHPSVLRRHSSFEQSMMMVPDSLEKLSSAARSRILSMHPLADQSVPIADTRIDGASERTIWLSGHVPGIAYGVTLYAPAALHFLKQQAKGLARKKN